jgi:hypothetical protein
MKAGKFLKYFILLVVAGNLVLVAYVFLGAAAPKPTPMPNPNGYDDFVKAGQMLNGDPHKFSEMNEVELRSFVSTNEAAFSLAKTGLSRECRMPQDFSPTYMQQYYRQPMAIKALALTFCAQGKLAKLEGRTNDSVESYLQTISLGEKSSRGGFMIAKLVGIACEYLGREGLQSWAGSLDAQNCRKICQALEAIGKQEESADRVLAEEKKYISQGSTLGQKLAGLKEIFSIRDDMKDFTEKFQQNQLQRRQMMLAFAARAYELENGSHPASVADLVPAYLKSIPQDPVTGTNLVLKP